LERKSAIRTLFFRQEKFFQDLLIQWGTWGAIYGSPSAHRGSRVGADQRDVAMVIDGERG
jgi:hypothetical protein